MPKIIHFEVFPPTRRYHSKRRDVFPFPIWRLMFIAPHSISFLFPFTFHLFELSSLSWKISSLRIEANLIFLLFHQWKLASKRKRQVDTSFVVLSSNLEESINVLSCSMLSFMYPTICLFTKSFGEDPVNQVRTEKQENSSKK